MDTLSRRVRSRNMSRIGQKDSLIEWRLRSALHRVGLRYRKHVKVFGTPDLVLKSARVVIFVDSCFWHGCPFHYRRPKSNSEFWQSKIDRNRRRDRQVTRYYRRRGWRVLRFWEHRLRQDVDACVVRVKQAVVTGRAEQRRSEPKNSDGDRERESRAD